MKFAFLFLAILSIAANAQQRETAAKLMCSATLGGQRLYVVLNLDYAASTVNGNKAVFANDSIKWTTVEKDAFDSNRTRVGRHELNRLAGSYSSYTDGVFSSAPPTTFFCEKAPTAKF